MPAIKMSLEDIRFAKTIVYETMLNTTDKDDVGKKISHGDKKILLAEFAKRSGLSNRSLANTLSGTKKSPKMSDRIFKAICNEFYKATNIKKTFKNQFEKWKKRQENLFLESAKTDVTVSEFDSAISVISSYFKRNANQLGRKFRLEYVHFGKFEILHRKSDKNLEYLSEFPEQLERLTDALGSDQWLLYEMEDQKIIRRKLKFTNIPTHISNDTDNRFYPNFSCTAFYETQTGMTSYFRCEASFLYSHIKLVDGSMLNRDEDCTIYNFSYADSKLLYNELTGHKMVIHRPYNQASIKAAILQQSSFAGELPDYSLIDLFDGSIPEFIRAFFSRIPELSIDPDPFAYLNDSTDYLLY